MIIKNNKNIGTIYKGLTEIASIYKGTTLFYENYVDKVVSGTNAITLNKAKADSLEYLKLFGDCKQKDSLLPDTYRRLDYIETDGNCWIEIPIVPDANTELEATASHIITVACQLMITQATQSNEYFMIGKATATQKVVGRWKDQTLTSSIDGVDKFTAIANSSAFYVNGTKVGDFTSSTPVGMGKVDIFRGKYVNNIYYTGAGARLHDAIIRKSGSEVFHGIPAINSSNVIGLYDIVTDTFLTNKGSGSLIAGPLITPLWCNNGKISICRQSGLPLTGYTKLNYVKNSSSTRIKTNIIPTVDDIEIELRCRAVTSSWYMFQSRASSSATAYGLAGASSGSTINFSWGGTSIGSDIKRTAGHMLSLKATAKNGYMTLYVKDETSNTESFKTKTYSPASYPSSSFYLWGNYAQYLGANANVYYLKFKVGGVTVLEYIPAKNSNDVAGFYDRATNTFISTPTAGTMTGGSEETDNIGVYVEGTQETAIVNYFDRTSMVVTKYGVVATSGDTLGTTSSNAGYNCSTYIKVLPSTQYTTILPKASTISTLGLVYYSSADVSGAISGVSLLTQKSATYTFDTPSDCNYIRFTWSNTNGNDVKLIKMGNTATAQNLLAIDDYKDEQEVLTGAIIRKTIVRALNGTENWAMSGSGSSAYFNCPNWASDALVSNSSPACYCSHYLGYRASETIGTSGVRVGSVVSQYDYLFLRDTRFESVNAFTSYLTQQYNAGTPVIIVYPLATSTTETVTGQALTLQKGNNIISISQASIDDLSLEAKYKGK